MYGDMREIMKSVVSDMLKDDPSRRHVILDEYDRLSLSWLKKPGEEFYIMGKNGIQTLDASKFSRDSGGEARNVYLMFANPRMEEKMTSMNASYTWKSRTLRRWNPRKEVELSPAVILSTEKKPMEVLLILAHEIAHKLGPRISAVHGYGLRDQFLVVRRCFQDQKSIRLVSNQEEEVFADMLASEGLARMLTKYPLEQRKDLMRSGFRRACESASEEKEEFDHTKLNHPPWRLRIAGVIGVNPSLRSVLGCQGEPSKYKMCGLNLPIPKLSSDVPKKGETATDRRTTK
jgi:hypothetical protein